MAAWRIDSDVSGGTFTTALGEREMPRARRDCGSDTPRFPCSEETYASDGKTYGVHDSVCRQVRDPCK